MAADIGTLAALNINGSAIHGIQEGGLDPGIVAQLLASDGYEGPTKVLVSDQQPVADFASEAIDTLLALNSTKFANEGVALSGNGWEGFFATLAADGGRGSTGTKYSMANGVLIPVTLNAPTDGEATISCQVVGRSSDGDTVPLAVATGQTLPTFAAHNCYSASRCEFNGTAIDKVQNIRLDFGIQLQVLGGDGAKYSDKIVRLAAQPTLTITTLDMAIVNAIGVGGVRQNATDSTIFLRKYDPAGTRVALTPGDLNISITLMGDNGLIAPAAVRASQQQIGAADVIYRPVYDGTNPTLTIDTSANIT